MGDAVAGLQSDPDGRVRFQLALTLGRVEGQRALDTLAALAIAGGASDRWFRIAILSSAADRPFQLFERLPARDRRWQEPAFLTQLAALIGARHDRREMAALASALPRLDHPEAVLTGLARGLKLAAVRNLEAPEAEAALARLIARGSGEVPNAAWGVASYLELHTLLPKAASEAKDANVPPALRAAAIRALRGGPFATAQPVLRSVLDSNPPPEAQRAVVDALASFNDAAAGSLLLSYSRTSHPPAPPPPLPPLLLHP